MAKYIGAKCRLCRREGVKLFLKGERCLSEKCCINKNRGLPGQHKDNYKKKSDYCMKLREKQKVKRAYGLLESQFKKYYSISASDKRPTGDALLSILESRLDNIVYRIGMGKSRAQARQIVSHGHISVNGKYVDIPSYIVSKGDKISISTEDLLFIEQSKIENKNNISSIPNWISKTNINSYTISDTPFIVNSEINTKLIIEFYSK